MKVLHVIAGLENGGAEAALYRLITGSRAHALHVVASLMDVGFYGNRLMHAGVQVHPLKMPRGRLTIRGLLRLDRIVRSAEPDVIQTWMYHGDLVGGLIARLAGKHAVVWGVHHSNLDRSKTSFRTRSVARLCALLSGVIPLKIICCSEQAASFHSTLGYAADKITVVHNGVDVNEFCPDEDGRRRLRDEWGIGKNEILLGMVARWDPQKDHATLIAASRYLSTELKLPWRCVLVGPGMEATNKEIIELLKKYGVRDHFLLAGTRSDIPVVMNAFDLHVLSSSGEAFGNATIEAMSCGIPSVVTSVGAGATLVGECGWVVPPSDPAALGRIIMAAIHAMSDSTVWSQRKLACRARVIERFSMERMSRAYADVWGMAVAQRRKLGLRQ